MELVINLHEDVEEDTGSWTHIISTLTRKFVWLFSVHTIGKVEMEGNKYCIEWVSLVLGQFVGIHMLTKNLKFFFLKKTTRTTRRIF